MPTVVTSSAERGFEWRCGGVGSVLSGKFKIISCEFELMVNGISGIEGAKCQSIIA